MKCSAAVGKKDGNGSPYSCQASTPERKDYRFPRQRRITREAELEAVKQQGKRFRTQSLEVRVSASLLSFARVGIIVPKYQHTVVERNRLRRRLREIVRTALLPHLSGVDMTLRSLPHAYTLSFSELAADVQAVYRRLQ